MPVSHYQRGDSCGFIKNLRQEVFSAEDSEYVIVSGHSHTMSEGCALLRQVSQKQMKSTQRALRKQ